MIGLNEDEFTVLENLGVIPAKILRDSTVRLANPVEFRITPLTVNEALARRIVSNFPTENPLSPDRASKTASFDH